VWLDALRQLVRPRPPLQLHWIRRGGWLDGHLIASLPHAPHQRQIEATARRTNARGAQPLAEAYGEANATRHPEQVRSSARLGDLYAWLVAQRRPDVVVEFGSAFGVSGMYFVSGMESVGCGHLYSFEINSDWADIAEVNIRSVAHRCTLTRGSVEELLESVVPSAIDMALVDAIHTCDAIRRQYALLKPRMAAGALLLFDDIDFPKAGSRMREGWLEIAAAPEVVAAVEINGRLGIVELQGR
jgi:predicted O-methyltransferase YrrM